MPPHIVGQVPRLEPPSNTRSETPMVGTSEEKLLSGIVMEPEKPRNQITAQRESFRAQCLGDVPGSFVWTSLETLEK